MTRRVGSPIGSFAEADKLVQNQAISYVQAEYSAKWISRASPTISIGKGNHQVEGIDGALEDTDRIRCLHAPLRSRFALELKAERGRRVEEFGFKPGESWQLRRFKQLAEEGCLDAEWSANSYQDDELDVYGTPHRLVFDPTLADLVSPWVRRPLWRRLFSG